MSARPSIRDAGDSALLLELDERIDPAVNARAIGVASSIRTASLAGVRDVVPTYRSVAVHFDPLAVDVRALRARLEEALRETLSGAFAPVVGKRVEIPVAYGGENGPDLDEVATWARLDREDVVTRHAGVEYRVFMLGFLPGFAYLGPVDARIASARRATPRLRVPAGSVGIAGRQTGVYPRESPGGWQIIGRTSMRLFDPGRQHAALLQPGDSVRFVRVTDVQPPLPVGTPASSPASPSRTVTVLRPGLVTTIQDEGRWGHQADGVPVGGALDRVSHSVANAAVGNPASAATIEVTIVGPELRFEHDAQVAVAGADLEPSIDGVVVRPGEPVECRAGAVLRFGARRSGARAYVAFDGGVDVEQVLGSRATHVAAALGGVGGRALVAGDRLPLGPPRQPTRLRRIGHTPRFSRGGARLRVLAGPQEAFPEAALDRLERVHFEVTPRSDRMGYRLSGGILPRVDAGEMISDATFTGAIQVPPSGEPILLMHDRQTTGGYPQIATVITADLHLAGQLAPGDWVEFERCTMAEALAALAEQEAMWREHR